ncbi:MAG TPA: hypothetical protein VGI45_19755 [Terracidiphilus sp.]
MDIKFINERDETVTTIGHYCQKWIETLPDDMDIQATSSLENDMWACVAKAMHDLPKLKIDVPSKVEMQDGDDQYSFVMSEDTIRKLDGNSGVYIAGVFEDASDRLKPATYCVRIDKKRQGQQVSLCHSIAPPKRQ